MKSIEDVLQELEEIISSETEELKEFRSSDRNSYGHGYTAGVRDTAMRLREFILDI